MTEPTERDAFLGESSTSGQGRPKLLRTESGGIAHKNKEEEPSEEGEEEEEEEVEEESENIQEKVMDVIGDVYEHRFTKPGKIVCTHSSLVGLTYLISPDKFTKIAWVLLIVTAITLTIVQIWQKIQQFVDHPYATNIDMSYPSYLYFPAVAICNTNQFRLSYQVREVYPLITELKAKMKEGVYSHETDPFNYYLDKKGNISSKKVMLDAGHQIEDMILTCQWPNGQKCTAADFTPIVTDYGVCYAMNMDPHEPYTIYTSGSGSGIHMLVNLEAYERLQEHCVTESNRNQGLVVVLFNQTDKPNVRSNAISIPNGFNVDVSVRGRVRKRKEGCTDSSVMDFFHHFQDHSQDNCVFDQHLKSLFYKCGCLPYNAPNDEYGKAFMRKNNARYCTMKEHVNCIAPNMHRFTHGPNREKPCLDKCIKQEYDTSQMVTYLPDNILPLEADITDDVSSVTRRKRMVRGTLESTKMDDCVESSILNVVQWNAIDRKYRKSLEAQWRFHKKFYKPTDKLIKRIREANKRLEELMWIPLEAQFQPTLDRIMTNISCVPKLLKDYPEVAENMDLEKDDFTKLEDLKLILNTDIQLEDTDQIDELYAENLEDIEALDKPKGNVKKTLKQLWIPYSSESYQSGLPENLTTYTAIFDLIHRYQNGTLTRTEWASSMLAADMENFWKKKYPEIFYWPVSNEFNKMIVGHIRDIAEEANEALNLIMKNTTLLRIAAISELKSADDTAMATMYNFLKDIQNCTFDEFYESAKVLLDIFQEAINELEDSFDDLLELHRKFLVIFKDKPKFVKENFVSINIFYQNLAEEYLVQTYTYDGWSLLCDVGGTLGLFIGASILSVIEVFWLYIFGYIHEREERRRKRREMTKVVAAATDISVKSVSMASTASLEQREKEKLEESSYDEDEGKEENEENEEKEAEEGGKEKNDTNEEVKDINRDNEESKDQVDIPIEGANKEVKTTKSKDKKKEGKKKKHKNKEKDKNEDKEKEEGEEKPETEEEGNVETTDNEINMDGMNEVNKDTIKDDTKDEEQPESEEVKKEESKEKPKKKRKSKSPKKAKTKEKEKALEKSSDGSLKFPANLTQSMYERAPSSDV